VRKNANKKCTTLPPPPRGLCGWGGGVVSRREWGLRWWGRGRAACPPPSQINDKTNRGLVPLGKPTKKMGEKERNPTRSDTTSTQREIQPKHNKPPPHTFMVNGRKVNITHALATNLGATQTTQNDQKHQDTKQKKSTPKHTNTSRENGVKPTSKLNPNAWCNGQQKKPPPKNKPTTTRKKKKEPHPPLPTHEAQPNLPKSNHTPKEIHRENKEVENRRCDVGKDHARLS